MHLGRDLETLHLDLVDIWPQEGWGNCSEIRPMCLYLDCWTVVATVKQGEARWWNTVKEHHSREHVQQGPSTALLYLALSSSECATVPWALIWLFICSWCSNSLNSCLYIPSCRMLAPKATSAQVFDSGATNNAAALILGGWMNISGCTLETDSDTYISKMFENIVYTQELSGDTTTSTRYQEVFTSVRPTWIQSLPKQQTEVIATGLTAGASWKKISQCWYNQLWRGMFSWGFLHFTGAT